MIDFYLERLDSKILDAQCSSDVIGGLEALLPEANEELRARMRQVDTDTRAMRHSLCLLAIAAILAAIQQCLWPDLAIYSAIVVLAIFVSCGVSAINVHYSTHAWDTLQLKLKSINVLQQRLRLTGQRIVGSNHG